MKYQGILSAVQNTVWPILPEKLDAICGFLSLKAAGLAADAETVEKVAASNRSQRTASMSRSVAVLPLLGTISQRMDLFTEASGGTSTERWGREFDALVNDPEVGAIILDVDSPGGNYYGTPELAEKVYKARGSKPIVAVANSMAASAAYWIATAADELVVTPSGDVGSVGVVAVHFDMSMANEADGVKPTYVTYGRYKAEFNPDSPLSDEALGFLQSQVDVAGERFVADLARNRGVTPSTVRNDFGQGRMFNAREAKDRGMADRIDTLENTIARLAGTKTPATRKRKAEADRQRLALAERS